MHTLGNAGDKTKLESFAKNQICEGLEDDSVDEARMANQQEDQFSQEMIKDQERLLTSLKQQGVPDILIQRQFNRLLQEQKKQIIAKSKIKTQEVRQTGDYPKRTLSSDCNAVRIHASDHKSLNNEKVILRNNGLQDPSLIKKNRICKTVVQRLNGTQDKLEMVLTPELVREPKNRASPFNGLQNSLEEVQPIYNKVSTVETDVSNKLSDSLKMDTNHCVVDHTHDLLETRVFGGFTYLIRKTIPS